MKVTDYGDMLSQYKKLPLIAYVQFGSYQGEWVSVLDNGDTLELWKGYYGSCSGCDFIEAMRDWNTDEIPDEEVKDYFSEEFEKPFLVINKEDFARMSLKDFETIFPANIRVDIYDFKPEDLYDEMRKGLTNANH